MSSYAPGISARAVSVFCSSSQSVDLTGAVVRGSEEIVRLHPRRSGPSNSHWVFARCQALVSRNPRPCKRSLCDGVRLKDTGGAWPCSRKGPLCDGARLKDTGGNLDWDSKPGCASPPAAVSVVCRSLLTPCCCALQGCCLGKPRTTTALPKPAPLALARAACACAAASAKKRESHW